MPTILNTAIDSTLRRIRRMPFYYRRYNNTLEFRINSAYAKFARECREEYVKQGKPAFPPSPLETTAATCLREVFPREKALAYSEQITRMIAEEHPAVIHPTSQEHLHLQIKRPLETFGEGILDVLRSPKVDSALKAFFQSEWRIEAVGSSRTLPAKNVLGSWLWHSDSFPPYTCKLFLHLTDADTDTGATEFMNLEDTMAYRRAGYFGQFQNERKVQLEDFARERGLPYRPFHFDAKPGDATLFNMNFFHRAVAPRRAYRDTIVFYFLPSMIPWEQHYAADKDRLMMTSGSFPKDPRPGKGASASSGMMH